MKRGHRVKASEDQAVWRRRLGHPAYGVLIFYHLFLVLKTSQTSLVDAIFVFSLNRQESCFQKVLIKVWVHLI